MLPDRVSNPGPLTYESGTLQVMGQRQTFKSAMSRHNKLLLIVSSYCSLVPLRNLTAMVTVGSHWQ